MNWKRIAAQGFALQGMIITVMCTIGMIAGPLGALIGTTVQNFGTLYAAYYPLWRSDLDKSFLKPGSRSAIMIWIGIALVWMLGLLVYLVYYPDEEEDQFKSFMPVPVIARSFVEFTMVFAVGCGIFRAHKSEPNKLFKLFLVIMTGSYMVGVGECFPTRAIAYAGAALFAGGQFIGVPLVHFVLDPKQEGEKSRDYAYITAFQVAWMPSIMSRLASIDYGNKTINAFILIVAASILVKFGGEMLERGFGERGAKFCLPGFFYALELSQTVLFIGTDVASMEFWSIFMLQELASVLRNSGFFTMCSYKFMAVIGKTVPEDRKDRKFNAIAIHAP